MIYLSKIYYKQRKLNKKYFIYLLINKSKDSFLRLQKYIEEIEQYKNEYAQIILCGCKNDLEGNR